MAWITERRRQALVVAFVITSLFGFYLIALAMVVTPDLWIILIPYLIFIWFDIEAPSKGGGRKSAFVRSMSYIDLFRAFFPIRVNCDGGGWRESYGCVDPNKNYMFCYSPHGFFGLGCIATFGSDTSGLQHAFPGLDFCLVTLKINFYVPFYREWLLAQGMIDASRQSIETRLRSGPGKSLAICPGGAAEALEAADACKLVLKTRKGFCRIALRTGAQLVPVYAWGETKLYSMVETQEGSWPRRFQNALKKATSFTLPLVSALMPKRHAVDVVIGAPLEVEHIPEPTSADVDALHARYLAALTDLFNKTKIDHPAYKDRELVFV